MKTITGSQIRAGRALLRLTAEQLATLANLGVATVRRAELFDGEPSMTSANMDAVRKALEVAGVLFVSDDDEGPGVRLRKGAAASHAERSAGESSLKP